MKLSSELNQEEKKLLVHILSDYYKNHLGSRSIFQDQKDGTDKTNDEDQLIRSLANKFEIRDLFPDEIKTRW